MEAPNSKSGSPMRAFAIVLVALAAVAMGFFVGRITAPDPAPEIDIPGQSGAADSSGLWLSPPDPTRSTDPREELLQALEQPAGERNRAVRRAMNAWLAADGAEAIAAARDDPRLREVADRMIQLALHGYPEVFLDDPSLLDAFPDAERLIASAAMSIGRFDPDTARALIERHVTDSEQADAMLYAMDHIQQSSGQPPTVEDARAELESILAERKLMERLPRLHMLIGGVASHDPAVAAALVDEMPRSASRVVTGSLIEVWSRTDPEAAARWLADKDGQTAQNGLHQLAWHWSRKDLEAANAYADTLTGARRTAFLGGLANTVSHLSTNEMLAWMSRYEDDPAYPGLVGSIAGNVAQEDVQTALSLVESLPEEERASAYASVIPTMAWNDPEAAVALVDEVENETMRASLSSMAFSMWAQNDAESALEQASGLRRGPARDQALASIASAMMHVDVDSAIDAIDEIDDGELRGGPVSMLVMMAETEDEAIRFGRRYGLDRERVLEVRSASGGFRQFPGIVGRFGSGSVQLRISGDADQEQE